MRCARRVSKMAGSPTKENGCSGCLALGTGWRLVVKGNGGWACAFKAAAGYPEAGSENARLKKTAVSGNIEYRSDIV